MRLFLVLAWLALSLGQASAQAGNADPKMVAAAGAEGKVVVYSPADPANAKFISDDFHALYPQIEVDLIHVSTTELYSRYLSQMAAGASDADVLWSDAMDLQMKLVSSGYALPYASLEKSALPPWASYKDELYATTLDPSIVVYNKRLVPADQIPKTHDDLVKILHDHAADLRSKFTTYDLQTSGAGYDLANADMKHWPNYWSLIAAQGEAGAQYYQSGGIMVEMIASGQYAMGYNLPYPYARLRQQTDPNVGIAFLDDYVLAASRVIFISKAAPHPNAAKLFVDYMLSKRGQELLANKSYFGSIRSDVSGDMTAAVLAQRGLVHVRIDPDLVKMLDPSYRLPLLAKWRGLARR